ncbi:flagellar assembly factor FliW [Hypnocyclicus thermotrophus]|uniref:Flagellar assembly factor FliW n=1 Tax=Hypnocyclicus thermotrophus TaxID=1627895 RepID=A0AA46I539_9FUSO|nr:flagellar assembly protein FliW [Hypnocyclicus thermotrophus]TDT68072.1 flagellar assembly factor FliW [Hypnocyclicus thermotrophus]
MKLNTSRFGEIEILEDDIVIFKDGIFGFENIKRFTILNIEENNPLMWLLAIDDPELAFVIIRPFEFNPNYSLNLADKDAEELDLEAPEDSDIFAIVVVPEDPSKMTANLQGPIVINTKKKIGKQVISTNPKHKLKHYILEEMQKYLG